MLKIKRLKINSNKPNPESGQAVLIAVILSLTIATLILFGISLPVADQIRSSNDYLLSRQALINSETLNEEVTYRLNKNKTVPSVLSLSILDDDTSSAVSDLDLKTKQVISTSNYNLFTRQTKAILSSNRDISFNYGAWLSSGGLRMDNSSQIIGDVFSLGDTLFLNSSSVGGKLSTSTYSVNLPISDDDINNWKTQGSSGIVNNGSITLSNVSTTTAGALKVVGNLTLRNSSVLTLNGPLYVTGNLTMDNSTKLQVNSSYGTKSETIVVDGIIDINSSAYLGGSGQSGSSVILATQNSSGCDNINCTGTTPAIKISNSAVASAILVAPHGAVYLSNSSNTKGVLANYLYMSNSSTINFDPMLINLNFNSSTSTFWTIDSLKEI